MEVEIERSSQALNYYYSPYLRCSRLFGLSGRRVLG
jgi:hypothetical protein